MKGKKNEGKGKTKRKKIEGEGKPKTEMEEKTNVRIWWQKGNKTKQEKNETYLHPQTQTRGKQGTKKT